MLDLALREQPDDTRLRTAHSQQRERVVTQALARAELALGQGRLDEAAQLVSRVGSLAPGQPRLLAAQAQLAMARQAQARQAQARQAAAGLAAARAGAPAVPALPQALAAAYQKPVALEFREAPLRQVFESLARSTGINFVFDKDVRGDAKVTVFLRQVSLDEALRVILATQQLDRKLLNDSTVLVYPNTPAKQREHQELVTRTLYLENADAKQVLTLVRTMAKTRDLYADDRLNALVVRDTPEVVRLVEQLVGTLDLAEPEVMMAVEVMEVASNRLDELGLSWPETLQYGLPGATGQVALGEHRSFRGSIANPAVLARLRGESGSTNLLANPTIRARNREKAKVQVGEKLPVFTTTAAINVGVSTTVTYVDVGLKLDMEPTVQGDDEVTIKVALEVTNLLRERSGPGGSLAYQVGTRMTSTSLRLRDGETQVLAGLINDEDRQGAVGVPGLSAAPVLGRLFGVQSDIRNKTEVVMLITPRIIRRLQAPPLADQAMPSGTDSQPGAAALRLRPTARVGVGLGVGVGTSLPGGRQAGEPALPAADAAAAAATADAPAQGNGLLLSASGDAAVGGTASVTLLNRSAASATGTLVFDPQMLAAASAGGGDPVDLAAGRWPFQLAPKGEWVVVLRALPAAAGQSLSLQVSGLAGVDAKGQAVALSLDGEALIRVAPAAGKP